MSEQRWEKWEAVIGELIPKNAQARMIQFAESGGKFSNWYDDEEVVKGYDFHVVDPMDKEWEFRIPASPEPPKIIPHIPWLQSVVATFEESDQIEFQRRLVDLGQWVVAKKQENEQRKEVTA